jgi:hypothetical protein
MALNWKCANQTTDTLKASLEGALKSKGLPSFADISWQGNELCVRIDKGGKSEFRLALKQNGADATLVEVKRDVAFLHKPFVGKVEGYVAEIMGSVGAQKT